MTQKFHMIFVSSTYVDLAEERTVVAEALTKTGFIPQGMELFGARSEPPIRAIREQLKRSDYYILVVANRYGSYYKNNISYTEYEYQLAYRTGKKPLVFIYNGNQKRSRESSDKKDALDRFKSTLYSRHTVDFFKEPNELAMKVLTGLQGHINRFPRAGWIRGDEETTFNLHTDQNERSQFYRKITKAAKKDILVFGTTLAQVARDTDLITEKLEEDVRYRIIGLCPSFVAKPATKHLFQEFFSAAVSTTDQASFSERVVAGHDAILTLASKIPSSSQFEYRTYEFFPTANMTAVDGAERYGVMVYEHIEKGNRRITFPGIRRDNVSFKLIRDQYEDYWNSAKRVV